MVNKFDDELYIPDEEMKVPERARITDAGGDGHGTHLLIILAIAISGALLIVAGLFVYDRFFLSTNTPATVPDTSRPTATQNQEPESDTARAEVDTLEAMSPSDQLPSIITDLENTRLDNLDAEINAIEAELAQ